MKWFLILAVPGTAVGVHLEGVSWDRAGAFDTLAECQAAGRVNLDPRSKFCVDGPDDGAFIAGAPVNIKPVW